MTALIKHVSFSSRVYFGCVCVCMQVNTRGSVSISVCAREQMYVRARVCSLESQAIVVENGLFDVQILIVTR